MKISKIFAKNFAAVSEISVNIDPTLTYLVGSNASGKSTVGYSAVFFVMKGLAQRGDGLIAERFRFIGPHGKSAAATVEIIDEKEGVTHTVTRKLLKGSTDLKIVSSDGVVRDAEFLNSLFSAILFNVMKFSELSGKEQALAFGVDTTEFDQQRKALEVERLAIYQDLKRLKGTAETSMGAEKIEEVSTPGLIKELRKGQEQNKVNEQERTKADNIRHQMKIVEDKRVEIEQRIAELKVSSASWARELSGYAEELMAQNNIIEKLVDADEARVQERIEQAEGINAKARAYKDSLENQKKADAEQAKYDAKDAEIAAVDAKRTKHIKASKLPYGNTTISEDGEFRLNSKPFSATYFSTGECMKFGSKLASKIMAAQENRDKLLEYVYVPHAESLDQKHREELLKELADLGLQVVAEFVSTEKIKKQNCILLKEMRQVESYDEKKKGAELL